MSDALTAHAKRSGVGRLVCSLLRDERPLPDHSTRLMACGGRGSLGGSSRS